VRLTRIVVCAKVVPTMRHGRAIEPSTGRIVRDAGTLSDLDRHALEEAIRIKERGEADEVVCVTVAPGASTGAVKDALGMGADRGEHVADPSLKGSDMLATSRVLASVLASLEADLILFGPQGEDSAGALLWAAVAGRLDLPVLSQATELTIADGRVTVTRQTEAGYETLTAAPPCLVSVSAAINQPRYVSARGKLLARRKPHNMTALSGIGVDPALVGVNGAGTKVLGLREPPPRGERWTISDGPDAARQVFQFLREKKLLP
jgi:electron transfer flavoprotein beta subunit